MKQKLNTHMQNKGIVYLYHTIWNIILKCEFVNILLLDLEQPEILIASNVKHTKIMKSLHDIPMLFKTSCSAISKYLPNLLHKEYFFQQRIYKFFPYWAENL